MAFLLAFTGVAMADSTTVTSQTALTVNVITPLALSCPSALSYNLVAGTSSTVTPAAKSFSCTTTGGPTPSTGGVSLTYILDQIPTCAACGTDGSSLASASDVQISADGGTTYVGASTSTAQTLVAAADTISSTYNLKLLLANEAATLPAGAYIATITFTLAVTYAP
jgi:hypothetical protein